MDVEALKPGEDFNSLKPSYVIFICTFDPFGKNLYRYTYENICLETGDPLGDGTRKIYLNTSGSSVIDVIHGRVKALKHSREWDAKFMTFE